MHRIFQCIFVKYLLICLTGLANKELVVTGKLSNEVGQSTATAIVNGAKMEVVENNITNSEEITKVVNKVTNEYNTTINPEQTEEISRLLEEISKQKAYGHPLYTWDEGESLLCKCQKCGGYVLVQKSEFHSFSDDSSDSYYTDYFFP